MSVSLTGDESGRPGTEGKPVKVSGKAKGDHTLRDEDRVGALTSGGTSGGDPLSKRS